MQIAKRLNITPSATGAINDLANKKKSHGVRVYNLSAGEPMLATDKLVVDEALFKAQAESVGYSPIAGLGQLRQVACNWLNDFYGADYFDNEILVSCGGKYAIYLAIQSLINPGDEAIIVAPYWVSYQSMVQLAGGAIKIIQTNEKDDWKPSARQFKEAISDKTKLIILNNASNPTGCLYTRDQLEEILKLAKENDLTVISDEVYSGLAYDGEFVSLGSFKKYRENTIVIQSCSKNFAMTGWRVGFAFGPDQIIRAMRVLQSQSLTNTSTVSQWAAVAALKNADRIMGQVNQAMQKRRDVFVQTFNRLFENKISPPPSGLYCFVSLEALGAVDQTSVDFCRQVLEDKNVAIVPGSAFGREGYVRFSFGADEGELVGGLEALAG
ncbi:MAG: aspartate aminotransferase [Candidatus Magasanikbacteria bacterium CG10_big_fil_rev_8_21_14_0_10_40_10]|uniref:Aminotransferase n=1 Tax=Candidatus Magasanikbacteria bacterium CG10_big_fil_rev_8_21_14_0_10_40_10 TaxID=1974648 RepID=A0A2M6W443_9BACT|nr:MAG: aspartate aminotransferase [Candidatus Magasanikbacteria bacterium CG10_big_fil_rev_8_21_14_0_10_40_10]